MIPPPCEYEKPSSLSEAIETLRRHGSAARLLAGGQSLIPIMKARELRPGVLIDITGLSELRDIAQTVGSVRIGALVTHAEIEESADLKLALPIMREAALQIGDPMIRNRGTFGGSLAHADPGADWPAVALALDAALYVTGPRDERLISIDHFFSGERVTALESDELLTHVAVPIPEGHVGMAYLKLRHFASGYALVGAAAVVTMDGEGAVRTCRLAITGAGPHAVRATHTESMLEGRRPTSEIIASAAQQASEGMRFLSDVHASETYRARLVTVYARRALELALRRCSNDFPHLFERSSAP